MYFCIELFDDILFLNMYFDNSDIVKVFVIELIL